MVIVTFPSKEAADADNSLPETAAMAEKMGHLEPPAFRGVELPP